MRMEITRDEFQELTRDLLDRTEMTTSFVVKQAGLDWSRIDRILLVGGSSRMPMVRDMLRRYRGWNRTARSRPMRLLPTGLQYMLVC